MKSINVLLVLNFFYLVQLTGISAQENPKGIVLYGHIKSLGMGAPIGIDYNAELIFDDMRSTYSFQKDALEGGHKMDMVEIKKDERHVFVVFKTTTTDGYLYHVNREMGIVKTREVGYNYVRDSLPVINWEIANETRQIGEFECTKATCTFRGRNYTAWFTPMIPVPYGPWKLQGLPGLILEAYDRDKEVFFYFKSLDYPTQEEVAIVIPDPATNTDMEKNINPSTVRDWMSDEEFKNFMIERYNNAIIRGRMFGEQNSSILSAKSKVPMKSVFIEVFQ